MHQHRIRHLSGFVLTAVALAVLPWAGHGVRAQSGTRATTLAQGRTQTITDAAGRKHTRMKRITQRERQAAANRLRAKQLAAAQAAGMTLQAYLAATALTLQNGPNGQLIPDYFGTTPNYANSPLLRKFVDGLPGLGAGNANNLGQYLPIATPNTTAFPGSDYYEIELGQYTEQMHSDLPATTLRGYRQTNMGGTPFHFLGPVIVAQKGRPVRIRFTNNLPTGAGGNLFLPVDSTIMGSGPGPQGPWTDPPTPADVACQKDVNGNIPPICYAENRATLHLHGGVTPWISDGTPHQWITPANENTAYPEGVSVYNVPDMPNPGGPGTPQNPSRSGAQTFYYTNDQSARLMFYHDHAWGITRLNVYAGEAAGYLITDAVEQALIDPGDPGVGRPPGVLASVGLGIPLVLQDKTFVDETTIGQQDPTWTWGTGAPHTQNQLFRQPKTGDLWWPHVYMPAQNPYDLTGTNAMGRWVYGPWFWPPTTGIPFGEVPNPYYDCGPNQPCTHSEQPPTIPGTPQPSWGAEAFLDTPVVNGTAYPYVIVPAGPVRFRILNAAHDRFFNLSLYEADDGGFKQGGFGTEVALNPAEVLAAKADPGGVFPTPVAAPGPSWIAIGTEGGFLPKPVVVPPRPITWVTDPTVFNAGNVDQHSLLLGPAERADVIVDFSAFAGKTLILYNDAPAAFPARDPRYDYYTDNADLTGTGGAPTTQPGHGPNTRTIMQIRVGAANGGAINLAALDDEFRSTLNQPGGRPGVFQRGQDPVIVGQSAYNEAYDTTFPGGYPNWGLGRIQDFSISFRTVDGRLLTMATEPKAIQDEMGESFDDYGRMSAKLGLEQAIAGGGNQNFTLQNYADPPTELVKLSGVSPTLIGTADDGTQIWRVTHNGVDTHPVHFHLFHVQLLNRVGWDGAIRRPHPTELGWKDTVRISPLEDTFLALRPIAPSPDSLPFRLPNSVRPLNPAAPLNTPFGFTHVDPYTGGGILVSNELTNFGWEYVWHCHILSHEENDMMRSVVFAVPPEVPLNLAATSQGADVTLTWIDNSLVTTGFNVQRADDHQFTTNLVTIPLGRVTTYTDRGIVPSTPYYYRVSASNTVGSQAPGYKTITAESGWSNVASVTTGAPPSAGVAPAALVFGDQAVNTSSPSQAVTLSNAVGAGDLAITSIAATGDFSQTNNCGSTLASGASCTIDVVFTPAALGARTGSLDITSNNPSNLSVSLSGTGVSAPNAPSNLTATAVSPTAVNLAWTDSATNETGFRIERRTLAANFAPLFTVNSANVTTFADTTASEGTTYEYRVFAFNASGDSQPSNIAAASTPPLAPTNLTAAITAGAPLTVTLAWVDNSAMENGFTIQRATNTGFTAGLTAFTVAANVTMFANSNAGLLVNTRYFYRVRATNGAPSAWSNTVTIVTSVPARPTNLAVTGRTQTTVSLSWADNSANELGFYIERATNNSFSANFVRFTGPANTPSFQVTGLNPNRRYYFRVRAFNGLGTSQPSPSVSTTTLP